MKYTYMALINPLTNSICGTGCGPNEECATWAAREDSFKRKCFNEDKINSFVAVPITAKMYVNEFIFAQDMLIDRDECIRLPDGTLDFPLYECCEDYHLTYNDTKILRLERWDLNKDLPDIVEMDLSEFGR